MFPSKQGFFPYVWLLYLLMPALNLRGEQGLKLLLGVLILAVFAVTYRQLYWARGRAFDLWLTLQLLLIVVLSLFYSPYNIYMGYFASNFVGWYSEFHDFRRAYVLYAVIMLGTVAAAVWNFPLEDLLYLLPFLVIMLAFPFGARSLSRKQALELKLEQANKVIKELVQRDERMRIARDLHDTMGHTLSLLTLKSQLVEKLALKQPERAAEEAREIQRISRAALRQVRELVSDMRAVTLAEGLAEAGEMLRSAEIALETEVELDHDGLSDLSQNILSLCLKEAVTNIVKHSGATRCRLGLELLTGEVRMTICDNGVGLAGRREGNGLKGMAERLSLVDGSLTVDAPSGDSGLKGTCLTVVIPRVVKEREEGLAR